MDMELTEILTSMELLFYHILLLTCIGIMLVKHGVYSRAILVEPPHRSSLWRFQYNTTINTRDDSLNCGGYDWQWNINKGRCGVCGDKYGGVEDHSDHGKFASGIIVRKYKEGHYINITFEVSSNYLGYVEFRMCPRNSTAPPLTQSCFDLYPLWIDEAHGTRYYIGSRGGIYDIHIRLPGGLVCRKCVLQWKYKTGYRYNGEDTCQCLGCGQQEQFINCADIEIYPRQGWRVEQTIVKPEHPHIFRELTQFTPRPSTTAAPAPSTVDMKPAKVHQEIATPMFEVPESIFSLLRRRLGFTTPFLISNTTAARTPAMHITSSLTEGTSTTPSIFHVISTPPTVIARPLEIVNVSEGQENLTFLSNGEKIVFTVPKIGKLNDSVTMNPTVLPTTGSSVSVRATTSPNTQFVSVSNILSRFFPEYTPPFMFPLRGKSLTSLRLPHRCDVTSDEFRCVARGIYNLSPGVNKWCELNCKANNCVTFMCKCSCEEKLSTRSRCRAVNKFRRVEGMDQWCAANCKVGYCPPHMCSIPHCLGSDLGQNGEP